MIGTPEEWIQSIDVAPYLSPCSVCGLNSQNADDWIICTTCGTKGHKQCFISFINNFVFLIKYGLPINKEKFQCNNCLLKNSPGIDFTCGICDRSIILLFRHIITNYTFK